MITVPVSPDTPNPTSYDPVRLVAEIEVRLHHAGVATVTGRGPEAVTAAAQLLSALGVQPVDQHTQVQYQVRLISAPRTRQSALAADEDAAEIIARPWRSLSSTEAGRTAVVIEPVATPVPLVGAA